MMDGNLASTYTNTVAVIVPTYNSERFVEKAIRSVMNQTFTDWRLIAVDDGSTDATCSVVRKLQAEDCRIELLINTENVGAAKTRNRGVEYADAEYVAFLDSDDVWLPEKLEVQLDKIRASKADLAYTSYSIINEDDKKTKPDYIVPETVTFEKLLKENVIGCSTALLKIEAARSHPFLNEYYHEDYVLWLTLLREGYKAVGCTDVLGEWRHLEESRSFDKKKAALNRWRIYRRYLKLPIAKSAVLFGHYAIAGLSKYFG